MPLSDGARLWDTRIARLSIPAIHLADDRTVVAAAGVKARARRLLAGLHIADGAVDWTWNAPGTVPGERLIAAHDGAAYALRL